MTYAIITKRNAIKLIERIEPIEYTAYHHGKVRCYGGGGYSTKVKSYPEQFKNERVGDLCLIDEGIKNYLYNDLWGDEGNEFQVQVSKTIDLPVMPSDTETYYAKLLINKELDIPVIIYNGLLAGRKGMFDLRKEAKGFFITFLRQGEYEELKSNDSDGLKKEILELYKDKGFSYRNKLFSDDHHEKKEEMSKIMDFEYKKDNKTSEEVDREAFERKIYEQWKHLDAIEIKKTYWIDKLKYMTIKT